MFKVLTIEREFGSGANSVAQVLSRRLGWKLLDQSLTQEIAHIAGVDVEAARRCDERRDSLMHRLGKVFWRGSFERSLQIGGSDVFDADRMVECVKEVVENAASAGNCIIVGRGAPYFLRNHEDAFHVFLYAPKEEKIRRIRCWGKTEAEAEELVTSVDRDRASFVRHYFGKEWPNRHLYHLMINTIIGDELVADLVQRGMESAARARQLPKAVDSILKFPGGSPATTRK